jgi:hypothetical protein
MAGFVRRYTSEPTIEVILQIEGVVIIDLAPPPPITGAGSGTVLMCGEMEDGPFAADPDGGVMEVYGSSDLLQKFGGFGYEYDGVPSQNPNSRRHLQELWNGNGFLKLYRLRAQRLLIARVDTSVGRVSFDPLACIKAKVGPYQLVDAQALSVTTNIGGPTLSTAVNAAAVTVPGVGAAFASISSGDTVGFSIDGGPRVNVIFAATDITDALVAARINLALGYTAAAVNAGEVDITGIRPGYGGSVEIFDDLTPGAADKIGHLAGLWQDRPRISNFLAPNLPGIVAADNFNINKDGAGAVAITFAGTPATPAAAAAVINAQFGSTVCYVLPNGRFMFYGGALGTAGSLALTAGVPDALVDLGSAPVAATGLYNVGDVNSVTAAEVAAIINGTAGLAAINVAANSDASGALRVCNDTPGGTILVAAGAMATALDLDPIGSTVAATDHGGGTILAGTRVRTVGGAEWVTMQTLDIPAGVLGPYTVRVRPALDDATAVGTAASTVIVLVDQPPWADLVVNNPAALLAAMTEPLLDNAYGEALTATLDEKSAAREANYLLCARRSDQVVRAGLANALDATANGLFARKFITGDPLGTTMNQIITNKNLYAGPLTDRLFYVGKGLKVRVAEIAAVGSSGGLGFTDDGVITVRPDGPLTTCCAILPPENNPGQSTGLIEDFFAVDSFGEVLDRQAYEAAKREGIALPRRDRQSGMVFQSGVTTSTDAARKTMARRKMADFIQDTAAELLNPFAKQLSRQTRRDQIRGLWESFLAGLQAEQNPELSRIVAFAVDDSVNAGNTEAVLAAGVYYLETRVKTLASLDDIVVRTEIGEGVVISTT